MFEFMFHPFFLTALFAGLAASVASGIIGSYVVTKRIVFISGSISHAVLGGMGFALWLNRKYNFPITPLQGALISAVASAVLLGFVHLKYKEREDSIIAALWATGASIGVIFLTLTPGYNVELVNFLFGNILWATTSDTYALFLLDVLVIATTLIFYRKFQAICFDEEQAALQGIAVKRLYILLLSLTSLAVVVLIQGIGAILVVAMLTIPSATISSVTHKLSTLMIGSILASMMFCFFGMSLAFELNFPPGATISIVAACFYCFSLAKKRFS